MLPDFTKLKQEIYEKIIKKAFEEAQQIDPLLSSIKQYIQQEGDKGLYQTVEGDFREQKFEKMSAEESFSVEDATDPTLESILKKFKEMGNQAASQMAQYSFKKIGEVIEETGNTIDAGGKLTPDSFLHVIEKIQIDFDDDTLEPKMPTMFIHPNQSESVRQMIKEAEADPKHKQKFEEIITKKREEWHDREAIRKLVD